MSDIPKSTLAALAKSLAYNELVNPSRFIVPGVQAPAAGALGFRMFAASFR